LAERREKFGIEEPAAESGGGDGMDAEYDLLEARVDPEQVCLTPPLAVCS